MRRIELYDTTLRDGSQGEGISFSLQDKLDLTERLDAVGFDYIEGGYPGSNEKDFQYFQRVGKLGLKHARVCAFGMTRRKGVTAAEDRGLAALLDSGMAVITLVGKASLFHATEVLQTSGEENLAMIRRERRLPGRGRARGDLRRRALLRRLVGRRRLLAPGDPGGGRGRGTAGRALRHQRRAHARGDRRRYPRRDRGRGRARGSPLPQRLRLGGGQFAGRRRRRRRRTCRARSTASASAAATPTSSPWPPTWRSRSRASRSSMPKESSTSPSCRARSTRLANLNFRPNQPFVGRSAFAHKGGMHVSGVSRIAASYEHIDPEQVGNERRVLVSELSGRANIMALARRHRHPGRSQADGRDPGPRRLAGERRLSVRGGRRLVRPAGAAVRRRRSGRTSSG